MGVFQPWGSHWGESVWGFPEKKEWDDVIQLVPILQDFNLGVLKKECDNNIQLIPILNKINFNLEVLTGERGGHENGPGVSVSVSTLNQF